ncbi:hypothetical protein T484DRAFT_1650332, partial [Baffinella frigidus]
RNSKPETRNPKPETRNPKPETRNPKPETLNPKPETRCPTLADEIRAWAKPSRDTVPRTSSGCDFCKVTLAILHGTASPEAVRCKSSMRQECTCGYPLSGQ